VLQRYKKTSNKKKANTKKLVKPSFYPQKTCSYPQKTCSLPHFTRKKLVVLSFLEFNKALIGSGIGYM
jgi:hypothetical protein